MAQSTRLPTMRQLEKMGGDAGLALDATEAALRLTLVSLVDDNDAPRARKALRASLRRLQARRDEFFGEDAPGL